MYSYRVDAWHFDLCDIYLAPLFITLARKDIVIFNKGKYLFTITSCECNIGEKSFIQSRKQSVRKGEEILRLFLIHL